MKPNRLRATLLLGSLVIASQHTAAEDIDIYAGAGANAALPNVLFVLDNAASFSESVSSFTCNYSASIGGGTPTLTGTSAGIQQCALANAIAALPDNTVNIGLMTFNENQMTGSPVVENDGTTSTSRTLSCGNGQGGCLIWPLKAMTPQEKTKFINFVKTWKDSGASTVSPPSFNIKSNTKRTAQTMQEAWAYYAGRTGLSGVNYQGIQPPSGCQQNYVIYIGTAVGQPGTPGDGGSADPVAALVAAGATAQQQASITITYTQGATCNTSNPFYSMGNHTSSSGLYGDEWSRFMRNSDLYPSIEDQQHITTYTIGVLDAATCKPDYPALLTSMATEGGGEYFSSTEYQSLVDAIATILNKIQAVNSAFASASLPISVNPQGNFLNQIFVGQFRPDADGKPRWMGNLKQYQFGVDTTDPDNLKLFLADGDGRPAIAGSTIAGNNPGGEEQTGFISVEARSFWTSKNTATLPDSIGGFWRNNPQGFAAGFDSPDGNIVEKGGVGERIRRENLTHDATATAGSALNPRRVYTCLGTNCDPGATDRLLSTMPFATTNTNITAAVLGITNPVNSANISSISRNTGTGIVTVNLAAAPSPAMLDPTTASISGSAGGQYDYSLSSASPSHTVGTTVLTYSLPSETPPLNPTGTYTATGSAAIQVGVTSLTRSTNAGRITGTATLDDVTFGGGANVAIGDVVNITGSTGYDGSGYTVTGVNGSNNITFNLSDSPTVYGGGGDIWVGASCQKTGAPASRNCAVFGTSNSNAPGVSPLPGLVRGVNSSLSSSHILMVNFSSGTTIPFSVGNTAKIQNATPTGYNSTAGYEIKATGTACSVTVIDPTTGSTRLYTGTADTATTKSSLCLDLGTAGSGFTHSPSMTTSGATVGTTKASRQGAATRSILSMTRGASNCPTTNMATVSVTTAIDHGFSNNEFVTIGSAAAVTGESAYNGNFQITTTGLNTFTFQVPTAPACTDSTSGMQVSYQDTAGGVTATDLIRWVRGTNNLGDEKSTGGGVTVRPSIHGDVLHSRPTVIGYPGGNTVVFYGSNDGVFRAINGSNKENGTGAIGGILPGQELWSFIPEEFYSKLQRLYFNTPIIKLHNTNLALFPDAKPKDYFFDGSIGVYQDQSQNQAHIYLSARRGGRVLYALDVSNPAAPKFMWRKRCTSLTDNTTCDSGFEELGQTWAQPKPARVRGHANPVLIFGAGYDPAEDSEPQPAAGSRVMGRGIYVLDAITGDIVWRAQYSATGTSDRCVGTPCLRSDMTYAIPSDVTLIDRTGASGTPDGFIDRLYVGDLGGNVWRVDLEPNGNTAPSNWQVSKLASVGGASSDATKRKIFFPPDVVTTKNFDAVVLATGDREHPVHSNTNALSIVNRFYMLKDTAIGDNACPVVGGTVTCTPTIVDNTSSTADLVPDGNNGSTLLFKAGTTTTDASGNVVPNKYNNQGSGFYITLKNGSETGEKAVNAPTTIGGNTFFGTNTPIPPSNTICRANLGTARGYRVNVVTGATDFVEFDGGGLPPSPVSGVVAVTVDGQEKLIPFLIGGGNPDPDCTTADCTSSLGGLKPPIPIEAVRTRTYWYREHDK